MLQRKHIKAPSRYDPGKGFPTEQLIYAAPWEMELLRQLTDGTISVGPHGIPSFVAPPSGGSQTKTNYNSGPGTTSSSGPTGGQGSNYSPSSGYNTPKSPTGAGSKNTGDTKTPSATSSSGASKTTSSPSSTASKNTGPSQGPMSAGQPSANRGVSQSSAPPAASRNTSQGPTGGLGSNRTPSASYSTPSAPQAPSSPSGGTRKTTGPASPMAGQGTSYVNPAAAMAANRYQSLKNQADAAGRGLQGISNTQNPGRGLTTPTRDPGNPGRGTTVPTRDPTLGNPSRGMTQPTMAPSYPGRGVTIPSRDPTAGNPSRGITPPTTPPSYPGRGITPPTRDPRTGNPSRGKTVPTSAPMANPSRGITPPTAPPGPPGDDLSYPGMFGRDPIDPGMRRWSLDPERDGLPNENDVNKFKDPNFRDEYNYLNPSGIPYAADDGTWDANPNNLSPLGRQLYQATLDSAIITNSPYTMFAGQSPRRGKTNQHPSGVAIDKYLRDPETGKPVGGSTYPIGSGRNAVSPATQRLISPMYAEDASNVANLARMNPNVYPGLDASKIRYGGFFPDVSKDYMHLDTGYIPAGTETISGFQHAKDKALPATNANGFMDIGTIGPLNGPLTGNPNYSAPSGLQPISYGSGPATQKSRVPQALGSIASGAGNIMASPGVAAAKLAGSIPTAGDVKGFTDSLPSGKALGIANAADRFLGTNLVGDAIGGGIKSGLNAANRGVSNMMGNIAGGIVAAPETISNLGSTPPPSYNEGSGRMPTSQEVASANKSGSSTSTKAGRDKSSSERNDAIRRKKIAQQLIAQQQAAPPPAPVPIVPAQIGYSQLTDAEREAVLRQLLGEDWA
jgi:hypothetical protein